uniref:Small ribosomal subunit protein mS29 n=1 Tax=Kalanchoe fedtschenkoi TaxID=63787 RepID=A0A7N0VHU9_KALFE
MLRVLVRRSATDLRRLSSPAAAKNTAPSGTRNYAKANTIKNALNKEKRHSKAQAKAELKTPLTASAAAAEEEDFDENPRVRNLELDENNKALDYGPNGRPLFTSCTTLSELTRRDVNKYYKYSEEKLAAVLPEGLPDGMVKEFEDSMRTALLVRQNFLDMRDHFRRIVDPTMSQSYGKSPKLQKQIVLDGPRSSGKSIALAMLVQWAREEGWLVLYVPQGKSWSHGGFFYKNPNTGLWDTPVQATNILQDLLKYNKTHLQKLSCQVSDPVPLGEGAGVGWMKGVDSMAVPEGSTLYDLIQIGLSYSHAAVGTVVRLRKELSLVKDIPVLIAIDQYNSWFTFSEFGEVVTDRSWRPIHAKELATVYDAR